MSARYRDDARELSDAINRDIEQVISKHWPGWIKETRKGKEVALLTPRIKDKGKKPTSSFVVNLQEDRGKWYRFSEGVGGYGLQLLYYGVNSRLAESKEDWADAYRLARELLGIVREREEDPETKAEREQRLRQQEDDRQRRDEERAIADAADRAKRTASAAQVWEQTVPLAGTVGEAYLVGRGLPPVSKWPWSPDDTIRFHPALDYQLDWSVPRHPALVGKVVDVFGDIIAVWQVYLDPVKAVKADLSPNKVGRGPSAGGAIRIGGTGEHIGSSEGMETALGAWFLESNRYPVWSMTSTAGVVGFEIPPEVKRITGWPDGDYGVLTKTGEVREPPGISAQRSLQKRVRDAGKRFDMNEMCLDGDALDLWATRQQYEKTLETHDEK